LYTLLNQTQCEHLTANAAPRQIWRKSNRTSYDQRRMTGDTNK